MIASGVLMTGVSSGVEAILTLGDAVGENQVTISATIDGEFSDTQTTTYSGSIVLELEVASDEVTSFEMTGGLIEASDISFFFGFLGFGQSLDFVNATALPDSLIGAETLTTPGHFSELLHVFVFNGGCLVSDGIFGSSKSLISDAPFNATGTGSGQITLGTPLPILSSVDSSLMATEYPVALSYSLDSTVTDTVDGILVETSTTGIVTASGAITVYAHPFYEWAAMNAPTAGHALAFDADANRDGVEDGLSWALGYEPDAKPQFPETSWDPLQDAFIFHLTEETRHPLTLRSGGGLPTTGWLPVSGISPVSVGTTGDLVISGVGVSRQFFQLSTDFYVTWGLSSDG